MSGWLAATSHGKRRAVASSAMSEIGAWVVLAGFACGLASFVGAGGPVTAQPPSTSPGVDKTNPVPADTLNRKALERFAVPGPNRLMFARIEDFKPVASQDENPQEYDAWIEVAIHANKFETR